jgi:hypothetical protein
MDTDGDCPSDSAKLPWSPNFSKSKIIKSSRAFGKVVFASIVQDASLRHVRFEESAIGGAHRQTWTLTDTTSILGSSIG